MSTILIGVAIFVISIGSSPQLSAQVLQSPIIGPPVKVTPKAKAKGAVVAIPGKRAPGVGPNILVNDRAQAGLGQSETSIAVDLPNIATGWNDAAGFSQPVGLSGFGVSTDGGTSFIDGGGLPLDGGNTRGDPAMTVCSDGTFFYANLFQTSNGDSALSVHGGTVTGGTINWGSPVIAVQSSNNSLDKEYLVCDQTNDNLYMSYTRFIGVSGNGQIEFVRSIDGGVTWSAPVVLQAQEAVVNQGSYPATGPDGEVCVAWQRGWLDANPTDTIEVRCSTNQGISFGPRVTAATFTSNAFTEPIGYNRTRVSDFPGIDIDKSNGPNRGTIYVAYQDGNQDIRDVKLVKSTDVGATWSAPVSVNDDAGDGSDEFFPWVNVAPDGTVGIAWYSNNGGITDVFLDASLNGGNGTDIRVTDVSTNWPATVSDISPNFGDYINLASSGSGPATFHVLWADGRNGDPDVFYASVTTGPVCDIQLSQASYTGGDTVTATTFRLANPGSDPVPVEWKVWVGVPTGPPFSVINLGADGSLSLPAGFETDFGPADLFPATGLALGSYELSCRLLDPVTGKLLAEDLNPFEIQ